MTHYVDVLSELEDPGDDSKPWADFVFDISSAKVSRDDGGIAAIGLEARGAHEGHEVGFAAQLAPVEWREQTDSQFPLHWGYVTLLSVGDSTDRLISLYKDWWDMTDISGHAVGSLKLLAAAIGCNPRRADIELFRAKLFFEPRVKPFDGDDPEHGQLYLNFDLSAGRAWLREKDPGYRRPVLSWLTGQFGTESHPSEL